MTQNNSIDAGLVLRIINHKKSIRFTRQLWFVQTIPLILFGVILNAPKATFSNAGDVVAGLIVGLMSFVVYYIISRWMNCVHDDNIAEAEKLGLDKPEILKRPF